MNFEKLKNDSRLPKHIGFIIDGNGRWARHRGLPRTAGHKVGLENLKKHIEYIKDLGIKNMSIYCFSTENWKRPQVEVDYLMKELFENMLDECLNKYKNEDVKIMISGDMTDPRITDAVKEKAKQLEEKTKDKSAFVLNFCINYGGRQEILKAVNELILQGNKSADEKSFERHLYTANMLPLDYVIRSGGESRTSNFLPWQSIYSEWYFPKTPWPSFSKRDLIKALKIFMKRNRRFGEIKG